MEAINIHTYQVHISSTQVETQRRSKLQVLYVYYILL